MSRARGYCFTINNYTDDDFQKCTELLASATYGVFGLETGKSGTPHIQGYGYWKNKISFNTLQQYFGNAHIEEARGTPEDNRKYCTKDGEFIEHGIIPEQGKRHDIHAFRDAILDGASEEELIMEYPLMMAKYDRFYQRCRNILLKKIAKEMIVPEVTVISGETGTGKTHMVYSGNEVDDVYKMEVGDGSSGSIFWDGYNGESVILIDDFHNNFKLDYMLRLLDKYPMKLNTKGNHTWKCAKKIYITSNIPIDKWYPNCPERHRKALRRRITTVMDQVDHRIDNKTLNG